ncbi:MAG TPA: thaumatin family protein [Ktedonobacteraceae bacterium]|nr:thaumatin family protein [Ktedonobacteraceae bacterium]
MSVELFFAKRSRSVFPGLIALLMCVPLLVTASCSEITGSNSIISTLSGGVTSSAFGGVTQFKMLDANNGWAATGSAILKTSDGGQHWTDVTPSDWEATANQGTPADQSTNKTISAAFFLDTNNAWMISSNTDEVSNSLAATAEASNGTATPTVNAQMQVYVRATIDGGKTWMDAAPITVTNLTQIYPPSFINPHEGWLTLTTTSSDGTSSVGHVYHTTDGGITWKSVSSINNTGNSDSLSGLTMTPNCTTSFSSGAVQCGSGTPVPPTNVQGCTTTGTLDTVGWLGHARAGSLSVDETTDSGQYWGPLSWNTPGGASGQTNDSLIVASPPITFGDGTGLLPIQMQSNPDGDDPSNFHLHLYKMSYASGGGANETDLGPTSPFVSQIVAGYHILSAPDLNHIFVLGQDDTNGTVGNTNLYEWNGSSWQTLISQVNVPGTTAGSTPPDLTTLSNESPFGNLDFISDNEGWITGGNVLYHIMIRGNSAIWTQVYPSGNTATPEAVTRTPGQVVPAPANPPACGSAQTPQPGTTPPAAGQHNFILVNNTSQTIWAAAAGNAGFPAPAHGGWVMPPGSTFTVTVANNWAGRFWGRTNCSFDSAGNGNCETGSCGTVLQCNGATAAPPQTLAEILLGGWGGNDFYDVSDVDGFNVPMTITPVGGAAPDPNNKYRCGVAGCGVDLNPSCPAALQVKDASGHIVGCNSACAAFGTDQYCCEGPYVGAACNPATWPVNYAAYFKSQCPNSYSYAYDDATSTFTDTNANYRITFGPASTS